MLWEDDPSAWIQTYQVNVIGTYLCCRSVIPIMLQQDSGKIINVSSSGAYSRDLRFDPLKPVSKYRYSSAYHSSKAAQTHLTEYHSYQLSGKNIQVSAMQPAGFTRGLAEIRERMEELGETEFVQRISGVEAGGPALTERSAELAVFLANDASGDLSDRLIWVGEDFHNLQIQDVIASDALMMRGVEL